MSVLYQGVVKNIVPAIASTNAIVAATCALETLKIATMCSTGMEVYMQYVTIRYHTASCTQSKFCHKLFFVKSLVHGVGHTASLSQESRNKCLCSSGVLLYATISL